MSRQVRTKVKYFSGMEYDDTADADKMNMFGLPEIVHVLLAFFY